MPFKLLPWAAIGTVAAILALALSAWLGYTSGTLVSPKLEFGFGGIKGIYGGDLRKAGLSEDGPVTYLVMTTERMDVSSGIFSIPFYITNRGYRALHDVLVRLNYPTRVVSKFDSVRLLDPPGEVRINPEYTKLRTVETTNVTTSTEFRIPILRPGEGLGLSDMFVLGDPGLAASSSTKHTNIRLLTFPERLREQVELLDVLKVKAFVSSSEAGPYTAELTVIWTRGLHDRQSIGALIDSIADAAWGPNRPKPGIHFKWPWEGKLSETEFFEFVDAPLSKGVTKSGNTVYVQHIEQSVITAFSSSMPPWDYWGAIGK